VIANHFHRLPKRALTVLSSLFALMIIAGLTLPPAAFCQEAPLSIPGVAVPLTGDPTPSDVYVPAATRPLFDGPLSATSTIAVTYLASGATDFWGNTCMTWPTNAPAAFDAAKAIWEANLMSVPTIHIEACWTSSLPAGTLGMGGPVDFERDFVDSLLINRARVPNTWYTVAAANAQLGVFEPTADLNGSRAEIAVSFSNNVSWYYGTDGNLTGTGKYDLMTAALREIAYGLGFVGSMNVAGGLGSWGWGLGFPVAYDRFAVNADNPPKYLISTDDFPNPSAALAGQLQSQSVYFSGENARAANSNANPRLYAPATWNSGGASYIHLNQTTFGGTANALMTPALNAEAWIHDPGPIAYGILRDVGWTSAAYCNFSLTPSTPPNVQFTLTGGTGSVAVATTQACPWTAVSNNASWLHVTSGASGVDDGTVGYSVDQYTGTGSRTGTMTIGGHTFTVNQTGCSYTLTPVNPADPSSFTAAASSGNTFSVATAGICPWTATESLSWASASGGVTGPGGVTYSLDANTGVPSRTGNINVADKTFVITQKGVVPVADFSGTPLSGGAPLTVTFTDLSLNSPNQWFWNFGDGHAGNNVQNPAYTYLVPGTFTVSLMAKNDNGWSSSPKTRTNYISVTCANLPVRYGVPPSSYSYVSSIGSAYGSAATGNELNIQAIEFPETLTFGSPKTVTLKGGYACRYDVDGRLAAPHTVINGAVTISDGTVIFDDIVIR
jgi:PKD repeat protein